jgi:putative transcriptional regulator
VITCKLSRILGECRLSQASLRKRTRLSKDTVSKLYHDAWRMIDRDTLNCICAALRIDISELLVWEQKEAAR